MSSTNNSQNTRLGTLYEEHLLLGALFGEGLNGILVPDAYERQSHDDQNLAFDAGVALADVSGLYTLLMHGTPAPAFAQTAFAGRKLEVGGCAFEAVLAGDGSLTAVPLLARTGTNEYAVWDFSSRSATLDAWLGFLSQVSQGGVAPFAGLTCEDVSEKVVPLVLWGRDAQRVLLDYLPQGVGAPVPGTVDNCALDGHINTLVASILLDRWPCYLMMVPPNQARTLWRSLLSFEVVTPVGMSALRARIEASLPWAEALRSSGPVRLPAHELEEMGLVRLEHDFVGARGLEP